MIILLLSDTCVMSKGSSRGGAWIEGSDSVMLNGFVDGRKVTGGDFGKLEPVKKNNINKKKSLKNKIK